MLFWKKKEAPPFGECEEIMLKLVWNAGAEVEIGEALARMNDEYGRDFDKRMLQCGIHNLMLSKYMEMRREQRHAYLFLTKKNERRIRKYLPLEIVRWLDEEGRRLPDLDG